MSRNNLHVFFYHGFYHLQFIILEAMIIYHLHFWEDVVLCFVTILYNMNVNGFMVIAIELKDKTKLNIVDITY